MSNDKLGPLTRALVGVPMKMLGIVMDIANRLNSEVAEDFYRDLTKFAREWKKSEMLTTIYEILVDHTLSLRELITLGNYDWVNENITEKNFPREGSGKVSLKAELLHFGRNISSENVITEMKKLGYRPATIWELLAFGTQNPELQRQFPIVALGSICVLSGYRLVPLLHGGGSGRFLGLRWFDGGWGGSCRFLVVRN